MDAECLMGSCDKVSVAGSVQNIVTPKNESDREFILRQIDIARRLHGIEEVILMNHTDCGAYGGRSAFQNEIEEEEKHVLDMREAKTIVQARFPELKVRLVLAKLLDDKIAFVEQN